MDKVFRPIKTFEKVLKNESLTANSPLKVSNNTAFNFKKLKKDLIGTSNINSYQDTSQPLKSLLNSKISTLAGNLRL